MDVVFVSGSSWKTFFSSVLVFFLVESTLPTTARNVGSSTVADNNNNMEAFFRKIIEAVRPEMKKGSAQVGIEVMDPLDVPDYRYSQEGDLVSIGAYFQHIKIPNLSAFRLDDVRVNKSNQQVSLKFSFPSISALGDYIFETTTLGMPVASATGQFQMTTKNVKAVGIIKLAKNPAGIYQCKSVDLTSTEDSVEMNMENLAGDNFLRNILDPRDVYNEYKPRINGRIADAIKKMLNYAFQNYTMNE